MTSRFRLWYVVALLVTGATVGAAESLRIVPIVRDDQVLISFELTDGFTEDVGAAISSGLRTTFTYDVELRMTVPAWVDRTVVTAVVSTSDQYDNLTRLHRLSRTVDGRVLEASVTEDPAVARQWLTTLTRVPLCRTSKLDPSRDYYVRISAHARPLSGSLLGWTSAVVGQAKFTFVP
jgi:hypothetical protein